MSRSRVLPEAGRVTRSQAILRALFATYVVLLVWLVMWKLGLPSLGAGERAIKLVPFVSAEGAGASAPAEVLANLVIFVPFGIYLGVLAPRWAWWKVLGTAMLTSLALEVAQYVLATGRSDLTDVIVNTLGGMLGFGVVAAARHGLGAKTRPVMAWVCGIGTVLVLVAAVAFVASPLQYGPGPHPPRTHVGPGPESSP